MLNVEPRVARICEKLDPKGEALVRTAVGAILHAYVGCDIQDETALSMVMEDMLNAWDSLFAKCHWCRDCQHEWKSFDQELVCPLCNNKNVSNLRSDY